MLEVTHEDFALLDTRIQFLVIDPEGLPVEGARISYSYDNIPGSGAGSGFSISGGRTRENRTPKSGRLLLHPSKVAPEMEVCASAEKEGYVDSEDAHIRIQRGETKDVTLQLRDNHFVRGYLVGCDPEDMRTFKVRVHHDWKLDPSETREKAGFGDWCISHYVTPDADGNFVIGGVAPIKEGLTVEVLVRIEEKYIKPRPVPCRADGPPVCVRIERNPDFAQYTEVVLDVGGIQEGCYVEFRMLGTLPQDDPQDPLPRYGRQMRAGRPWRHRVLRDVYTVVMTSGDSEVRNPEGQDNLYGREQWDVRHGDGHRLVVRMREGGRVRLRCLDAATTELIPSRMGWAIYSPTGNEDAVWHARAAVGDHLRNGVAEMKGIPPGPARFLIRRVEAGWAPGAEQLSEFEAWFWPAAVLYEEAEVYVDVVAGEWREETVLLQRADE